MAVDVDNFRPHDEDVLEWIVGAMQVKAVTQEHLMSDFDKLMSRNKALVATEAEDQSQGLTLDHMRRCFFGNYTDPDAEPSARVYKEVQDVPALITTMEAYLTDHNGANRQCSV